ncbi:glutathione peroxidase [Gordoniibacillus kamchatkensis]|uniref:Glutathione peroxidase n=1 Tax=Gordoniibacillus kamchatkensis TaxID=1590651 RepID=A0ABR5AFW2_9BACL|nr:glutathione peroxidase [Paenibacillus sp. VKM B-2647]KIL39939.1 glutathione peroxidase [Paenibacillus sp. VKM B-2647]
MSALYDISAKTSKGQTQSLRVYEGKPLLIVNLASQCGFTPQYAGLQKLHETYKDRGLHVLGFPCNDFGGQEPGTIGEIEQFCSLNYGVTFELFDKVAILGDAKHPLYAWLTTHAEPQGDVQWNFEKFLIDRSGNVAGRFASKVEPESEELRSAIEAVL